MFCVYFGITRFRIAENDGCPFLCSTMSEFNVFLCSPCICAGRAEGVQNRLRETFCSACLSLHCTTLTCTSGVPHIAPAQPVLYYLLTNWLAYLYGRMQSPRPEVMPDRREGIMKVAGFGFARTDTQTSW